MLVKLSKLQLMVNEFMAKNQTVQSLKVFRPAVQDPELMPNLIKNNVVVEGTAPARQGLLMQLLIASFPVLLIILLFMFFMRNMGGGSRW